MNKKVVVGISGGVDSSVAAMILKNQGYEVVGITFRFTSCFDCSNAIKVCKKLGIEHHIIDYTKEFKEKIIDKFIDDYKKGITPNPCVMCNKYVKLKFLHDQMIKYDCNYMATGHYAKKKDGMLYKSADLNKDQTYFLCEITKDELDSILFPLDGIDKGKVRKMALENNLDSAYLKDSTDVCFINEDFKDYISSKIMANKGDVIDVSNNKKVGTHDGLFKYTIGQRRGLNIGGTSDRMFVVGKDIEKNVLYVKTGDSNSYLISDSCVIDKVNWIYDKKITDCTAKFRYRQKEEKVSLTWLLNGDVLVSYPNGIKAVTPGQVCAFWRYVFGWRSN